MQVYGRPRSVGRNQLSFKRMQMCLIAGRGLQDRRLYLHEIMGGKPCPRGGRDARPRQQEWPPVGIYMRRPPERGAHHPPWLSKRQKRWRACVRSVWCAPTNQVVLAPPHTEEHS